MVEKMTAVWLIILTIIVCASVPALLIWLTTYPHATKMLIDIEHLAADIPAAYSLYQ
jgi:hypothetical protein